MLYFHKPLLINIVVIVIIIINNIINNLNVDRNHGRFIKSNENQQLKS